GIMLPCPARNGERPRRYGLWPSSSRIRWRRKVVDCSGLSTRTAAQGELIGRDEGDGGTLSFGLPGRGSGILAGTARAAGFLATPATPGLADEIQARGCNDQPHYDELPVHVRCLRAEASC